MALAKLQMNKSVAPRIAICIKDTDVAALNAQVLVQNYIKPLITNGVKNAGSIIFIGLPVPANKNITKAFADPVIEELLEYCDTVGISKIVVADAKYFGFLVPKHKCEDSIGFSFKCTKPGYEHIHVLPTLHYNVLHFNPGKRSLIDRSLDVLMNVMQGTYVEPGTNAITSYVFCKDAPATMDVLHKLENKPFLAVDIETTGLRFERDSILTIAFADSQHSGYGIAVDRRYHSETDEMSIIKSLKDFFTSTVTKGTELRFHNGLFDIKFLVRRLWMKHDDDYIGMQTGIDVFKNYVDTMIITYLATNSTVRPALGLKVLTQDFLGNYAVDTKDCTVIPIDDLLRYNIADVCGTNYVYDKYYPIMVADDQLDVYKKIFQPSAESLLIMMMTGLPIDMDRVKEARIQLQETADTARSLLNSSDYVKRAVDIIKDNLVQKYNESHKVKQKTVNDFDDTLFMPSSNQQMQILLFDVMQFDVLDTTESGAPSVGGAIIKDYITQSEAAQNEKAVELLKAILDISAADKVNNTFLSAFEELSLQHDASKYYFLNGNLKLGGTQSGRLSSSEPNLQNLPSNSIYGKLVKSCFVAPKGWLFCGADFSALEDKIGALLSKDAMKTLEFSKGVDGHMLRALAFFPEELPETDMSDVSAVNALKQEFPDVRQKAKAPSFALQYSGTWVTIQRTLGCTESKAKQIEESYHNLYSGLADFAKANQEHAIKYGYVNCAFGMRLRTPLLAKSRNTVIFKEAAAEARSSSNATSQSWGLLMNRAINEFYYKIKHSKFNTSIRLINTIHDAVYLLVKNDPETIKFVNDELIKSMSWQDHPLIKSTEVLLGAELDIGKDWSKQYTLKNNSTLDEIVEFLSEKELIDK